MEQIKIIYHDRVLKITKCQFKKGLNKYKIEMTNGRVCRSWEGYFDSDQKAIEGARQEFSNFM